MAKDKTAKKEAKKKQTTRISGMGGGARIKDMGATAAVVEEAKPAETTVPKPASKKAIGRKTRGKKYQQAKKLVKTGETYSAGEALALLKKVTWAKNSQTVELHLNVTDKGLRGEVSLPHFTGQAKKVAIFSDKLAAEIKSGEVNFDVLLASPADMPKIMPLAKILGPKGLLPHPKNNTIVPDPKKAAADFATTAVSYKTEKDFPLIHAVIGKISQPEGELVANYQAFVQAVGQNKIQKAVIKSPMSPAITVKITD